MAALVMAGLPAYGAGTNTADPVAAGQTDLSQSSTYATPPTTTSDVEFSGSYAGNTTFDVNGSAQSYGTLNDLDASDALTITNTNATAGSITLNTASNSVAPSPADLLYVAAGGNLTLQNGPAGSGALTLNLATSGNIDNAGTLNLNGPISLGTSTTAANTITFTGAGTTTVGGVISGTGGLTFNTTGAGGVTLKGVDTMTGAVVVNSGTVFINSGNTGTGTMGTSSSITINNGGTISIVGGDNSFVGSGNFSGGRTITINAGGLLTSSAALSGHLGTLVLNGGTLATTGAIGGSVAKYGSFDLDHPVSTGGTAVTSTMSALDMALSETGGTIFNVAAGATPSGIDLNVTGTFELPTTGGIKDNGLIKQGAGVMALANAQGYASNTTVNAGTLLLDFTQGTAPATNIINPSSKLILGGGIFSLSGSTSSANSQIVNGLSVSPGGSAISLISHGNDLLLNLGAMTPNGGTVDFTLPAGAQTATNGILTTSTPTNGIFAYATVGRSSFATVNSSGDIVAADTISTNVPSGGLIPNDPTANIQIIGGFSGAYTGINGNTTINSLTDSFAGTTILNPGASTLNVATGGLLVAPTAGPLFIGGPSGAGTITAGTSGATQLVLNNNSSNTLTVYSTIADNAAGSVSLAASGSASVTLGSANTFTGTTGAGAAGLILANSLALQDSTLASGNIVFSPFVTSNAFTVGGLSGGFTQALTNSAGAPVTLSFGQNNASNTFSGTLTGAGTLVKTGSGTETFSTGGNSYTGGLVINNGTVISTTGGGASGLGHGAVTINAGAILQGNGGDSFGYTANAAPTVLDINGGTVTSGANGNYRITLPDITFSNGGTLTSPTANKGDANGNFSFRGNPVNQANKINVANITVIPSGTTALINSGPIWLQAGTVNFNVGRGTAATDLLVNSPLINGGSVVKSGNGIMTLTAANTYTGTTSVNGGTLVLDYTAASAPATNMIDSNGSTLFEMGGGNVVVNGSNKQATSQTFYFVDLFAGASGMVVKSNGFDVSVPIYSIQSRNIGATIDFVPPTGSSSSTNGIYDPLDNNINGILGGFATVNGTDWATLDGNQNIVKYTGYTDVPLGSAIPDDGTSNVRINGGTSGNVTLANGAGVTNVNSLAQQQAAAATLDLAGGTLNIGSVLAGNQGAAGGVLMAPGAGALNIGLSADNGIITTPAGTFPDGVIRGEFIFTNNSTNPLTINSTLVDNGNPTGLTKSGSGTLILGGTNTYTDQTTIGAGTLQVGAGGSTGQLGTGGTVVDNASLVFDRSNDLTVANTINGPGTVTQNGTGIVTLSKASGFTGGLTINSGTVASNAGGGNSPLGNGPVTVNAGGTLEGAAGDAFGYYPNAAPRVINVNGGTITEGGGTTAPAAYRVTLPNIVFTGGGTLTNPTGTTGNNGDASGNYSFFGAAGAASVTVNPSSNTATISATKIGIQSNLTLNVIGGGGATSDLTISSVLADFGGSHGVTVVGNGVTTLSGFNTFSGGLTVNGGTVISATTNSGSTGLGIGPVNVNPGGVLEAAAQDSFGYGGTAPATINVNGGTVTEAAGNFRVTLPNVVFNNGGTLTSPAGAGDGLGNYSFFGGTVTVNPSSTPAMINATQIALQAPTVNFNVGRGTPAADLIVNSILGPSNGTQGIIKSGSGFMSVTAPNTYTGTTAVNAGSLLVNNASGSGTGLGAVSVNSGGLIAGTGTIGLASAPASTLTVNPGGIISAGNGYQTTGTLTVANAATLASGSGTVGDPANGATYLWKINDAGNSTGPGTAGGPVGWDKLALNTVSVSGTGSYATVEPLSIGGGYVNNPMSSFNPQSSYQWVIATLSGGGGPALAAQFHLDTNALSTFAAVNNTSASAFSISSDPTDVYINYAPTPEPTSLGLLGLGAAGLLLRRRRKLEITAV